MRCERLERRVEDLVREHLAVAAHGWSVGTWGAIGEFQYDDGEPDLEVDLARLTVRSRRGALSIDNLDGVEAFALVDDNGRTREIALCSARGCRAATSVTALGDGTWDLGIGAPHIDMLVRPAPEDAATRDALTAGEGRPLLAADNPAGPLIARNSPARIFVSAIARLEVYQPIPPPGGRSPPGPHSHLLPGHLKEKALHAPGSPLPGGLFCGLSLYPRTRL